MNYSDYELSQNKLIILCLLDISKDPLSNTIISDFILEKAYTNYFSLQEFLNQMQDTQLIKREEIGHNSVYRLTKSGKEILDYLTTRIPFSTIGEIKEYLTKHAVVIRSTIEIVANYYEGTRGSYLVDCYVKDGDVLLMELKMTVFDKDSAIAMCDKWKANSSNLYKTFLDEMLA